MMTGWRFSLRVGVVALAVITAGGIGVRTGVAVSTAAPGWRLAVEVHQTKFGSLLAVTAISARNAWAGGCGQASPSVPGPNPVPIPTRPVITHYWHGSWKAARLPATLHGCVTSIEASSAGNVWAIGSSMNRKFQLSNFALTLRHGRWVVARWWGPGATKSSRAVGAAVLSKSNVWVFWQDGVAEHFGGASWHRSKIALPFPDRELQAAAADPGGGVWVLTGEFYVMRLQVTGGHIGWKAESLPGARDNDDLAGIYAQSPKSIWVTGGGQHFVHGHWVWVPLIEHWSAGAWHHVTARGAATLASVTSDGSGGLWLATQSGPAGLTPIVRYAHGRLAPVHIASGGKTIVAQALSSIPGSHSAWGVGDLNHGTEDLTGVILKYSP
ncbi:MAG TPA: hypothetical protein VFQ44_30845 [Streptosporangiaceae bacterium]|nr:hypothetical protein [Streptosporangiaceae bacterium]